MHVALVIFKNCSRVFLSLRNAARERRARAATLTVHMSLMASAVGAPSRHCETLVQEIDRAEQKLTNLNMWRKTFINLTF